jgi:hypothetical protein
MANYWVGDWENQYGSRLTILKIENGRLEGNFRSAVDKSIPASPITGICTGNLIVIAVPGSEEGKKVAAWTGVLQKDRIETLWHVAMGEKGTWEAFLTGADTFSRR